MIVLYFKYFFWIRKILERVENNVVGVNSVVIGKFLYLEIYKLDLLKFFGGLD